MGKLEEDILARHKQMKSRRERWNDLWQELSDLFLSGNVAFIEQKQEGERDEETLYDGTPRLAARDLAASIDGLIKPKTSNWFEPTVEDEDLLSDSGVKGWLEYVRERMWQAIYNPQARFIQRSAELDTQLVVFGYGVLWCAENAARSGLMFRAFSNTSVSFDENADGVVDTLCVDENLTARQAAAKFGEDNLHKEVREALRDPNKCHQKFCFAQMVLPQADYLADQMGPRGMPYASVIIDTKHEKIMNQGGFNEFPAAVPRWDTMPGQVYPRSPAMVALPDSLTLQAMGKTLLAGGERAADPPIMVPSDIFVTPIRSFPGGVTVYDASSLANGDIKAPMFPFPVANNLPVGRDMQMDYREQVKRAFFGHVLNMPLDGPAQTATEVLARKEEFIRALGPIFGRLESDYCGHIVRRVFNIMERVGAFPMRPPELEGVPIVFRYQSPIQQARKSLEVAGFGRTLEIMAPLAEVQPDIFDLIDGEQVMRDSPQWSGMPSDWLRTEENVMALRKLRARQKAQMDAVGAAKPIAGAIKDVAQAQALLPAPETPVAA